MKDPVCLIQWLAPNEYKEVHESWLKFAKSINITLHDVKSKSDVSRAIENWLADNPCAQYLYIGSHGNKTGFGRKDQAELMSWAELRALLIRAQNPPVVWLGTCDSSAVADAWSPITDSIPAAWLATFDEPVSPIVCQRMLSRSLGDSGIDQLVFVDQELPRLRAALPGVKIQQFYPACPKGGKPQYVNIDEFEKLVGVKFETFLKRQR